MAASISSMDMNEPNRISWRASRSIRDEVDSSESMRLPLSGPWTGRSSSAVTPSFFRLRISFMSACITLPKFAGSVPA